ncbi:MAG: hypothetical protein COT73_04655 [Bdellovibrio sp. CG10_big_fil_rev_8_21_14_0_10_47_8]|nr:MAG: hypothetical protein COT73_04655 [Bdellovibrio sp. CG10_big_fil_rev_8_21_14_0_10_47_8]
MIRRAWVISLLMTAMLSSFFLEEARAEDASVLPLPQKVAPVLEKPEAESRGYVPAETPMEAVAEEAAFQQNPLPNSKPMAGQLMNENIQTVSSEQDTLVFVDECQNLAGIESEYQGLSQRYKELRQGQRTQYDGYYSTFNQMTEILFQAARSKEEETQKIAESRDRLQQAVENFNQDRSGENTQLLKQNYMELTTRLYNSSLEAQKAVEKMRAQISDVESSRGAYENSKLELESLDQQKLSLEAKLISLKIRCQR